MRVLIVPSESLIGSSDPDEILIGASKPSHRVILDMIGSSE